jgi:predicted alpha/beta-fold hydrolase
MASACVARARSTTSTTHLGRLRIPSLVLHARNDPFIPAASLPRAGSRHVMLWQPTEGGHVGFPSGRFPAHVDTMPRAVLDWLAQH